MAYANAIDHAYIYVQSMSMSTHAHVMPISALMKKLCYLHLIVPAINAYDYHSDVHRLKGLRKIYESVDEEETPIQRWKREKLC